MTTRFSFVLLVLFLIGQSCAEEKPDAPSSDMNELKKFISLERYQPNKVKWTYSKIGDASDRIPGPTDYALKAEMEFSPSTIEQIKKDYLLFSVAPQPIFKKSFQFDWLSKTKIKALGSKNFHVYQPVLFGVERRGSFIILDDKTVLLHYSTC